MRLTSKISSLALVALTLFAGCIPSVNPVYNENQLIRDDAALGVWVDPDTKEKWEFTKRDGKSYTLVYTDEEGRQGRFVAHLAKIQGTMFLDLFPEERKPRGSDFYNFHLVPIHTIYLVRRIKPNLELATIDYEWLQKHLDDNPGAIQNASLETGRLLTAPTKDVQNFVLAHKEAFTGDLKLQRVEPPAN
jgi:hypothetical protein